MFSWVIKGYPLSLVYAKEIGMLDVSDIGRERVNYSVLLIKGPYRKSTVIHIILFVAVHKLGFQIFKKFELCF